jgi:hypothetical protein
MHTMRRGYCSKLSGQIENLDHNKRAILRYEKQESMTFDPTRPDPPKFLKNLDPTRPAGRPDPWTTLGVCAL